MRIVVVGGGFGGLACAKALGNSPHQVLVIDKKNFNLFQPLLYQVATGALSPADIAEPIRRVFKKYRNISTVMAEVERVDTATSHVVTSDGRQYPYDVLILATGSRYSYFGHDDWAQHATSLKTVEDARLIRTRLLTAFERAEKSTDPEEQRRLTTTVVIGGGPTGVEMAGAIAELGRWTLEGEFRNINPSSARVILVEGGQRLLGQFPEKLALYAQRELENLGVEIWLKRRVTEMDASGVRVDDERVPAGTIVWGAGVTATPAAQWLGLETDRTGRIPVEADLSVVGFPGIYALGDITAFTQDDKFLPGLAQVAKQQGRHLGEGLRSATEPGQKLAPFRYHDRGNTAVIGRHAAIFDFGRHRMKGRLAWLLWAIVHVYLLVNAEKRALVSLQWLWRYITKARGVRLIP
ncbi:NAD(P)/FAD-dependent oxidoreductase [Devosia submarina]|uniref:NAD(P)/FAD-dependent oxidoreductase n=1 Tax=Devosia submarina TaxID=1173082 RepID=UPI000D36DCEF|nr:NAD(P)/FAD-dependent oxidoreductase [Devosia submarina]